MMIEAGYENKNKKEEKKYISNEAFK